MHHFLDEPEGPYLVKFHHENNPDMPPWEYDQNYRRVLFNGISGGRKLFLDTNFWVWLRDADPNGTDDKATLLRRLREGTRARQMTCVLHVGSFMEFAKQKNPTLLKAIAEIADELCEGVCLASRDEQRFVEAGELVSETFGADFHGDYGRWTHVGQMFRSTYPKSDLPISKLAERVIDKCLIDAAHTASLSRILQDIGGDASGFAFKIEDSTIAAVEALRASNQAKGIRRLRARVDSFCEILQKEYFRPLWFHTQTFLLRDGVEPSEAELRTLVGEMIEKSIGRFNTRSLGRHLASAAIIAELYSLYEAGDLKRRLKSNDWVDWDHAASALPHCDAFFCERHLAALLNQSGGCANWYGCRVAGSVEAALRVLDEFGE